MFSAAAIGVILGLFVGLQPKRRRSRGLSQEIDAITLFFLGIF